MKIFHIKIMGSNRGEIEKLDRGQFIDEYPIKWSNTQWWVFKNNNKIIAYICAEPNIPNKNYIYLSRSFVVAKYRGLGLHKRLIRVAMNWARKNNYKIVWSSINPWNYASGNSLISCGYKICKPITKKWKNQLLFFHKKL